jgi:hypothetical protein
MLMTTHISKYLRRYQICRTETVSLKQTKQIICIYIQISHDINIEYKNILSNKLDIRIQSGCTFK